MSQDTVETDSIGQLTTAMQSESNYMWGIIKSVDLTRKQAFINALAVEGKIIDDLLEKGIIKDDLVKIAVCKAKKSQEKQAQVIFESMQKNEELAIETLVFVALKQPGIINILYPELCERAFRQVSLLSKAIGNSQTQQLEEKLVAFREKRPNGGPLTILCTGPAGVGKSTLVNALANTLGLERVARTGRGGKCVTENVARIDFQVRFEDSSLPCTFWDTPGFTFGDDIPVKFRTIAKEIKETQKNDIDLVILCCAADAARDDVREEDIIKSLTREFGKEIWSRAVIILTKANLIVDPENAETSVEYFHDSGITVKKKFIRRVLSTSSDEYEEGLTTTGAKDVPCVPVGMQAKSFLPDGTEWRKEFWLNCIGRVPADMQGVIANCGLENERHFARPLEAHDLVRVIDRSVDGNVPGGYGSIAAKIAVAGGIVAAAAAGAEVAICATAVAGIYFLVRHLKKES